VNVDALRLTLGAPLAAVVLEITHEFLALGVDRDDRLIGEQELDGLVVDVTKLCVAIDVVTAFPRLAVGLQAIVHLAQQVAYNGGADLVPLLRQLPHEITQAPAGPQQCSHGVAARRGLNQDLEILQQRWIRRRFLLSPTTGPTDASAWRRHIIANVGNTVINCGATQTLDTPNKTNPAAPERIGFHGGEAAAALFIQNGSNLPISFACSSG